MPVAVFRIILENSGVAEPQNIRDKFNDAIAADHPLTKRLYLDTMVTMVDSATFQKDYATRTPITARPDLGEGGNLRPVVDLLVEQIEYAPPLSLGHKFGPDSPGVATAILLSPSVAKCSYRAPGLERVPPGPLVCLICSPTHKCAPPQSSAPNALLSSSSVLVPNQDYHSQLQLI
jgi:CobW/HypB/UreG, nucleotide-binding domain